MADPQATTSTNETAEHFWMRSVYLWRGQALKKDVSARINFFFSVRTQVWLQQRCPRHHARTRTDSAVDRLELGSAVRLFSLPRRRTLLILVRKKKKSFVKIQRYSVVGCLKHITHKHKHAVSSAQMRHDIIVLELSWWYSSLIKLV
jgi:hypothetical protein